MKLRAHLVERWPKLAWVASRAGDPRTVNVHHGAGVEVRDEWAAEAVWAGPFEQGGIDRTDLVFGSGLRVRGDRVIFVTSGTAMDRLWHYQRGPDWWVSNSLGALSAMADVSLLEDRCYANGRASPVGVTWGASPCARSFPTDSGDAQVIWFNNLVYGPSGFEVIEKPDTAPALRTFADYRKFLIASAEKLKENIRASARRHEVVPLASISSGYDSPAAAVIAKHAGCERAVTIKQANSIWRGSDSGEAIAEHLGMACEICNRTSSRYPHEAAFWAASGYANLLSWCLFDYPQPISFMFVGCYGDTIWARGKLPKPLTIDIWDDLAMGEFRLFVGMIQCPVPFWGLRHADDIQRITFSREMEPWTLHTHYDRPIARRLVEESGLPRHSFAVRKKNTSHEAAFRWPYSRASQDSFRRYLEQRGYRTPGPFLVKVLRVVAHLETLIHANILHKLGITRRFQPWNRLTGTDLLFHWANDEVKKHYARGLAEGGQASPRK